ncbi:MAG: hypothetical protein U5K32_02040 [Bacteroidales bacterium]|nr:hypothetical protein [Bacteroidales bacterium]
MASAGYRSYPRAFGYADNRLRGVPPWDIPDNPYTPELENSGGDAFDISWARDEEGSYTELDTVHFIRVTNAVLAGAGVLGELSTEIRGAVDVSPAAGITGLRDMIVIKDLPPAIDSSAYQLEVFVFHKGRPVTGKTLSWTCSMQDAEVDEDNILRVSSAGEISITASLDDDPDITVTGRAMISTAALAVPAVDEAEEISLYPNPAGERIRIRGIQAASIRIFSTGGRLLAETEDYRWR